MFIKSLSQVIVVFHLWRKSRNEKFLEFFQLFAVFIKIEICRLFHFPGILCPASLIDCCQKWCEIKCSLGLDIFCHLSTLHLNLAPCYIMPYFESTVDVIKRQVKASRTYTDTTQRSAIYLSKFVSRGVVFCWYNHLPFFFKSNANPLFYIKFENYSQVSHR